VPATTPSSTGASAERSEITPVAMLDWRTNENSSRRSEPSGRGVARGKRRNAARPADPEIAVETSWPAQSATKAAVTPIDAPTRIATSRIPIVTESSHPRRS